MKLQIVNEAGEKLDMASVTPEFIESVAETSPLMGMILTMAKLKHTISPKVEEKEETGPDVKGEPMMEEEKSQCNGDSTNCPICEETLLIGFSEVLEDLENGGMATRKSWIDCGIDGHISITPEIIDGEYKLESYLAFVDFESKTASPYTLTNDDILAKDWLLLEIK